MSEGRVLIFAGAGISAESGNSTFRDAGGLWEKFNVNEFSNYSHFRSNVFIEREKNKFFDFYNERKKNVLAAQPNKAHLAIADLQKEFGDRVNVVTSNVDDLFEKAGCRDVLHVHGDFQHMHCAMCGEEWNVGDAEFDAYQKCPKCDSSATKPMVVLFGETAPAYQQMNDIFDKNFVTDKDVILFIGSSMQVIPPNRFFTMSCPALTILVNKDKNQFFDQMFKHRIYGKATEKIDTAVELIRQHLGVT